MHSPSQSVLSVNPFSTSLWRLTGPASARNHRNRRSSLHPPESGFGGWVGVENQTNIWAKSKQHQIVRWSAISNSERSCSYGVEVGARSGQTGVRFHARLRNYSPHKTAAMPPPPPPGRWRFMVCEKRPRPALIPLPGPINMFDSISIPESRWGLNSWQSTAAIWWPVVGSAHRREAEEGEFRSDEIARCINIYRQIVLNTHSNHLHHTRTGNPDDPNATCGRNEVPHRCQFKLCKFRCSCFGIE